MKNNIGDKKFFTNSVKFKQGEECNILPCFFIYHLDPFTNYKNLHQLA